MIEKRDKKLSGCLSLSGDQIRSHRIRAHHLDARRGRDFLLEAAGACGLQNSPPGAWETALFNRIDGLSLDALRNELYEEKTLVQAWSFRGAPVVFPASESGIFLHPLAAAPGEEPWIYTRGISAALDFLNMDFEEVFSYVREAAAYLDSHTVTGKEELDQTLASLIGERLPADRRALWDSPSMYGQPDRQTAGGAAVSFLLRPCSFLGLTVFGKRTGASQDFTSYRRWTGSEAAVLPEAEKRLTEKYFHCYGPSTVQEFAKWLGCSPRQAKRLFEKAASALEPVRAGGKTGYILSSDRESFLKGEEACTSRKEGEALLTPRHLLLLGAHDPYLDPGHREILLEEKALWPRVWRTVANPGAVIRDGRIVGIWKTKKQSAGGRRKESEASRADISIELFSALLPEEERELSRLAEEYAAFRKWEIGRLTVTALL